VPILIHTYAGFAVNDSIPQKWVHTYKGT